jgi:exodeoxyribonuclease V beta subunit
MLDDLLHTRLSPRDDRLILAAIGPEERLNELEFHFPLTSVSRAALNRLLSSRGWQVPEGAAAGHDEQAAPELRGMMKGYIDLVFRHRERYYIVDWKSNHLGWQPADYAEERLPAVMAREGYFLQYLIYTVALHHYLSCRLPGYSYEEHFGGVFYLFLRGVREAAGPAFGIFRDKPDLELVTGLARCFAGQDGH